MSILIGKEIRHRVTGYTGRITDVYTYRGNRFFVVDGSYRDKMPFTREALSEWELTKQRGTFQVVA